MEDVPVTLNYAINLFMALSERAENDVFVGSTTEAFKSLGISQGYYSKLYALLYDSGSVVQEKRGSSHTPSILRLVRPPTIEDFRVSRLTNAKPRATLLEQRVQQIEGRLPNGIDLSSTIADFEARISDLESQIREVTQIGTSESNTDSTTE